MVNNTAEDDVLETQHKTNETQTMHILVLFPFPLYLPEAKLNHITPPPGPALSHTIIFEYIM